MGLLLVNELAVAVFVLPQRGVETKDPQLAEFALLDATISVGVGPGLFQAANRDAEAIFRAPAKALRVLKIFLVLFEESVSASNLVQVVLLQISLLCSPLLNFLVANSSPLTL